MRIILLPSVSDICKSAPDRQTTVNEEEGVSNFSAGAFPAEQTVAENDKNAGNCATNRMKSKQVVLNPLR